jgi:hypothetical protein
LGGGCGVAYTKEIALLETLSNEANLDPFQTCREYSRDYQRIVKFVITIVLVEDVEQLLALSGNVVLCRWILDQALSNYINSKYFFNGCFQVLEVFKKLVTIIFKNDVDQNGT